MEKLLWNINKYKVYKSNRGRTIVISHKFPKMTTSTQEAMNTPNSKFK